jgi:hypothetical protein
VEEELPMKSSRVLPLILSLVLGGAFAPVFAQTPLTPELQVNAGTPGYGGFSLDTAMNARGDLVVLWAGSGAGVPGPDLFVRPFAAGGTPRSGEILVSDDVASPSSSAAVAMRDDGSFLVLYHVQPDSSYRHLKARLFAPDGAPLTGVLSILDDYAAEVSVAVRNDGGFVVAWSDYSLRVFYRLLGPGGDLLGPRQRIGTGYAPSLATGPRGEMVVVWDSYLPGTPIRTQSVAALRLGPDGRRTGAPFQVARTSSRHFPSLPNAAFDAGGNFVVVWSEAPTRGIFARRFAADGKALGRIRRLAVSGRALPKTVADPRGGITLVWETRVESTADILARRFDRLLSPLGPAVFLGTFVGDRPSAYILGDRVASDGAGNFAVAWMEGDRILTRLFEAE